MKTAAAYALVLAALLNSSGLMATEPAGDPARTVSYVRFAIGGEAAWASLQSYGLRLDLPAGLGRSTLPLATVHIRQAGQQVVLAGKHFEDEGAAEGDFSTAAVVALAVGAAAAALIVSNAVNDKENETAIPGQSTDTGSDDESGDGGFLGGLPLGLTAGSLRIPDGDRSELPGYMGDLPRR